MSPTHQDTDKFLRLTGVENVEVWKTRIEVALGGKGLLGVLTHPNYQGESDSDSEMEVDEIGQPSVDQLDPSLPDFEELESLRPPSEDEDIASVLSSATDASEADDFANQVLSQAPSVGPPTLEQTCHVTRPERHGRPRPHELKRMEKQAKSFIFKTIDDMHTLIVKELKTAYEIYQTLCKKYEVAAMHGDPYYISIS